MEKVGAGNTPSSMNDVLVPKTADLRQDALVEAVTEILWTAGDEKRVTVVIPKTGGGENLGGGGGGGRLAPQFNLDDTTGLQKSLQFGYFDNRANLKKCLGTNSQYYMIVVLCLVVSSRIC